MNPIDMDIPTLSLFGYLLSEDILRYVVGAGGVYLIGSTLLVIVIHDGYFYGSHRLLHLRRVFKYAHKVHHKSHNPTPFTAYSFNVGEAAANALFLPLLLLVLPLHPLALFMFTNHMMIRNAIDHSGYKLFAARPDGRPLFDWMTTVTHHDIHHARAGYNFGLYYLVGPLNGLRAPDISPAIRRCGAAPKSPGPPYRLKSLPMTTGSGQPKARGRRQWRCEAMPTARCRCARRGLNRLRPAPAPVTSRQHWCPTPATQPPDH